MIKIGNYEIRPYPIYSTDFENPNFWYDIIKGERVVRRVKSLEEALELIR
jgi:hypothetical protein